MHLSTKIGGDAASQIHAINTNRNEEATVSLWNRIKELTKESVDIQKVIGDFARDFPTGTTNGITIYHRADNKGAPTNTKLKVLKRFFVTGSKEETRKAKVDTSSVKKIRFSLVKWLS